MTRAEPVRDPQPMRQRIAKWNRDFAKDLRKRTTMEEDIFFEHVRGKQLNVLIRRQHPVGGYIADFAILEANLIIEIDGGYHLTEKQKRYDILRTEKLKSFGFDVLRFTNDDVLFGMQTKVLPELRSRIAKLPRVRHYEAP